jgi:hypothetical protein
VNSQWLEEAQRTKQEMRLVVSLSSVEPHKMPRALLC